MINRDLLEAGKADERNSRKERWKRIDRKTDKRMKNRQTRQRAATLSVREKELKSDWVGCKCGMCMYGPACEHFT